MEPLVTKEQVIEILHDHGHTVVMGNSFIVGSPISEIEVIVSVCDVISDTAYLSGLSDQTKHDTQIISELREFNDQLRVENKQLYEQVESLTKANQNLFNSKQDAIKAYNTNWYVNRCAELQKQVEDLRQANRDIADSVVKKTEAEELEKAIQTIQSVLSGSFRDNLKIEITEQHAWLHYGDLKFLVEPMESWQAVQSCVYLSGLEVE